MEDININSTISESYEVKVTQKPLLSLSKEEAQARVAAPKHFSSTEDPLFILNDKIDDFINPISDAPSSHIKFENSTYTLLKKKSTDDNFSSQGKHRQKTQKNTTNTDSASSTNYTSRDNDQKDLFSLLGFKCVNDDETKTDTNDSIPFECKSPIKEILVKPKEEQEKTMKKIADDYYNQKESQASKKSHLELGRQMQEIRYWQAKENKFRELDLHYLTSTQMYVVIGWVFKSIGDSLNTKKGIDSKEIDIICGQGNHSSEGKSVLGPKLDDFLKEMKIKTVTPSIKSGSLIENSGRRKINIDQHSSFFKNFAVKLA